VCAALALAPALLVAGTSAAESPQVLYMLHCQGCHLPDGTGKPGSVPSLSPQIGRFLDVPGGRDYLVRVPGSFDAPLDDAELASVLNWMIRSFDPSRSFRPYSAREIARYREQPLTDVDGVRAALLDSVAGGAIGPPAPARADRESAAARESARSSTAPPAR